MNLTLSIEQNFYPTNSTRILIEPWFIPLDILIIFCALIVIILSSGFLLIIIQDKTCHTVPMLLTGNLFLAALLYGCTLLSSWIFTLENDLKQRIYQDFLCNFRGYLCYVTYGLQNNSYILPALYRYLTAVYPTKFFWRSMQTQVYMIVLTWIFSFVAPLPFLLTGDIRYNIDNQICQTPIRFSLPIIYGAHCGYMIPISLLMIIYFKLVRYVKQMSKHSTPANTFLRAQRELKMVRRIVTLVMAVTTIGAPYGILIFLSFFNRAPKHHFRIAYIFITVSMVFLVITLFQLTDPLKLAIKKRFQRRSHVTFGESEVKLKSSG